MTQIYYTYHLVSSASTMALTSGISCVDTLTFQLSLHRLDERRNRQSPYCFSWSEPFDLDFAEKPRSGPKRSRSLPNPLASKRKEIYSHSKDENQNDTIYRQLVGKVQENVVVEKVGFRAYSPNACTATKKLTSPLHHYANVSRTHKESEEETSDEELSAVAKKFCERQSLLAPNEISCDARFSTGGQTRLRKRVFDGSEQRGCSSKRARPTLDFEKMLSSAVSAKVRCNGNVLFEKTFFKPIIDSQSVDS